MLKMYPVIGFLLLLAIMLGGCATPPSGNNFYTIINGKKVPCSLDQCTTPFYAVNDGKAYYCTDKDQSTCTAVPCKPKFVYDNVVAEGETMKVVAPQQQDQNHSASPAQVTFISQNSATVTVTDSLGLSSTTKGSLSGYVGVLKATITQSVQVSVQVSVSESVTASIGNEYTFTVPAGETAYANYGVNLQITKGHLYDKAQCEDPGSKSDWGLDTAYVPIGVGWCVRTNKQPPSSCPSL